MSGHMDCVWRQLEGWDRCKCLICSVVQVAVNAHGAGCSSGAAWGGRENSRTVGQGWAGITVTPHSGDFHPFLPKGAFLAPCSHTCEPLFDSLENYYPAKVGGCASITSVHLPQLFVAVHEKITVHRLLIFQIAWDAVQNFMLPIDQYCGGSVIEGP